MRIIFTSVLVIFVFTFIKAQNVIKENVSDISSSKSNVNTSQNNKTASCIDTIYYPHSKMTAYDGLALMEPAGVEGVSQAFAASNGTIHGIRAFITLDTNGIVGDASPINMQISVTNIDVSNKPTTVIASDIVSVIDVGNTEQNLMFSSPVSVSGKYAIVVKFDPASPTTDTAYYMANNQTAGDGGGEGLMCVSFLGTWYNYFVQFALYDSDMLIAPIFEKTITASYTTDVDTVCLGGDVLFTNTSVLDTSYMYNLYNTSNGDLYTWSYDDGTGTYNHVDTTYTFSTGGTYNTQLLITNYGYTANCVDSIQKIIVINDTAVANFGYAHLGGGTYQFTDLSTAPMTWSWDFGDGSPLDNTQNPTHTYSSSNNYLVCLTVTDSNGCNIDSMCTTVPFTVGIENVNSESEVIIYPIPAKKYFTVSVPLDYLGSKIIITDILGQEVKSISIKDNPKVKILTDEIPSGVYFISIEHKAEKLFTKRIVVDK
jgi:hypothetical protein